MIQAPKGTKDILPNQIAAWQQLEEQFLQTASLFGFQEIRVPTFEQTELFQRGVGDTTDVVQKEMYTFLDKGGRSMTLRPEITASVVRAYLEHGLSSTPSPQKFCYRHTAFRYEKMGKGRYREFNQFGCEVFGAQSPTTEAEMIAMLFEFFKRLGLQKITLKINSIGCPACRPAYLQVLRDYLRPHLSEMCEDCVRRFEKNPMRSLDCKQERCQKIVANAPLQSDYLCAECEQHFTELKSELDAMGIPYEHDPFIVRGLDYYTKTVFEFVSENVGTQGTICGGGRYDGLVAEMGGNHTPAVGFALGVERLLMELEAQGVELKQAPTTDLYLVAFNETKLDALKLASDLRKRDIRVENDLMGRSFKAQMKYANKTGAKFLLVLGEDEVKTGNAKLKCMQDGNEHNIELTDSESIARRIING